MGSYSDSHTIKSHSGKIFIIACTCKYRHVTERFSIFRDIIIIITIIIILNSTSIQLEVDGTHLAEPYKVADAFAKYFQSVYNTLCARVVPSLSQSSEFLSLAHISELDICKALRRLRPSKSVGLYDIPNFVIKGCSEIFVLVLKHIFNLSLTQHYFPTVWKQAAVVPVFKKR
jgi:hypothetical protein